jgi:hypothetical protein
MGVHDCQDQQLVPSRQLVVNKVHLLQIVRAYSRCAVLSPLCFHQPFGCFIPERQAQLPIKPVDLLHVQQPAVTTHEEIDAPIAAADMGLTDFLDAGVYVGRIGATGLILIG